MVLMDTERVTHGLHARFRLEIANLKRPEHMFISHNLLNSSNLPWQIHDLLSILTSY